jgi:hypothetical protein
MKFNSRHFEFTIKSRRFKKPVWEKYYSLKKKKELTDFDKFWMKQFRAQIKINQLRLYGTHLPTNTAMDWAIKKDASEKKINKKEYLNQLLNKIKNDRTLRKLPKRETKVFEGAKYEVVGHVFEKPGQINPLAANLTINNPMAVKKPRRKDNYIGIELEFNVLDRDNQNKEQKKIAEALKGAGLAKYVDVTTDSSCGWEVRVLVLEKEVEIQLPKILTVLNSFGFQTNEKCGTHVHFDMRNRDVKRVYENLFKSQKFLRKFLTRSRKFNQYCKLNKESSFDKQLSLSDRYYGINVEAFRRHQTIEVRMHQGTLKADELIPWINLLIKIVDYKTSIPKTINTLKQAKVQFEIDDVLTQDLEDKLVTIFSRKKTAAPDRPGPGATSASRASIADRLMEMAQIARGR